MNKKHCQCLNLMNLQVYIIYHRPVKYYCTNFINQISLQFSPFIKKTQVLLRLRVLVVFPIFILTSICINTKGLTHLC